MSKPTKTPGKYQFSARVSPKNYPALEAVITAELARYPGKSVSKIVLETAERWARGEGRVEVNRDAKRETQVPEPEATEEREGAARRRPRSLKGGLTGMVD